MQLIIRMFHALLIPCLSLDQYLNRNLYTIPNMQNMRFFCCSVYIIYLWYGKFYNCRDKGRFYEHKNDLRMYTTDLFWQQPLYKGC